MIVTEIYKHANFKIISYIVVVTTKKKKRALNM